MSADEIRAKLTEYLDKLDVKDWDWVIPRQDRVSKIVGALVDGVSWPMLGGSVLPSSYTTLQRQLVETALVNLGDDPALADGLGLGLGKEQNPWEATADQLDELAQKMPESHWTGQAVEAQQLVRYVNAAAGEQIGDLVEKHSVIGPPQFPGAREKVIGVIRGAAAAARRHGPHDGTLSSPQTVVNVEQRQEQRQAAVSAVSIEDLLASEDLPDEVRPVLVEMKDAKDAGDREGVLKRTSDLAGMVAKFPDLASKIGDVSEWVSRLFG